MTSALLQTVQNKPILSLSVVLVLGGLTYRYIKNKKIRNIQLQWKAIATQKRKQRDEKRAALPESTFAPSVDAETKREICSLTAYELVQAISQGKYTAELVMRVYCERAKLCGEKYNSNAEEFFLEAIEEAKQADEYFKTTGKLKGPLHGVPISVKDQFNMKGADSTCGIAAKCFNPYKEDGLLVALIRTAGGIPFVRSNVPQLLMTTETANDIWGTTSNPYDTTRTCGGSSGGEAVLLSCAASALGIGTDVGGSIRIPATYCGIYGFKPTPVRITTVGISGAMRPAYGNQIVLSSVGPMGRCVEDLAILTKCWLVDEMWNTDPFTPRVPFDDVVYRRGGHESSSSSSSSSSVIASASGVESVDGIAATVPFKKLRIGYYESDPIFEVCESSARAVRETVAALEKLGHELVPFKAPSLFEGSLTFLGLITCDRALEPFMDGLQGEELHKLYKSFYFISSLPSFLRSLLTYLLERRGAVRIGKILRATVAKSAAEYKKYAHNTKAYRLKYVQAWKEQGLDALVCPSFPLPPLRHDFVSQMTIAHAYSHIFNLLHFPAGTVPVTKVLPEEQHYESHYKEPSTLLAKKVMENSAGLPIGVQVVTLPFQDELCLHVMGLVEKTIGLHEVAPL